MVLRSIGGGTRFALALFFASVVTSCSGLGSIDATGVSPISNDDTFETLGRLWGGARSAISNRREPANGSFTLPLSYQLPCSRGGQGAYQGTLTGTKTGGVGRATLALTATLAECRFDDNVRITAISAAGVSIGGTIEITNDAYGAINLKMTAPTVTVNGVTCPGGIDVTLTGSTPFVPPISTGTACGRTGAVPLP